MLTVISFFVFGAASALADPVRSIMKTYARSAVTSGATVGIGVAVIDGRKAPKFFTHGKATVKSDDNPAIPFGSEGLFEIASVTKIFTTNLLGQAVASGDLELGTRLSSFSEQIGPMQKKMSKVKLKELADFTGGITDYAPPCLPGNPPPGCLPSPRPTLQHYGGKDFADYFANATPMNYQTDPPTATKLPAPYFYSDYSVGLLGLLLAGNDKPLGNRDVKDWFKQVKRNILRPLKMKDTYLFVPRSQQSRLVSGYDRALATAAVENGAIASISLQDDGSLYSAPPKVRIVGGGGSGATAAAFITGQPECGSNDEAAGDDTQETVANHRVCLIKVTDAGSGYVAPAAVTFSDGGSTEEAVANAIVRNGKVVAVMVTAGGKGYRKAPVVAFNGGRVGGAAASATAYLVNGSVAYVSIEDGGSGYVDPLAVKVAPGGAAELVVPIWAAAGSLKTNLEDIAKLVQAAATRKLGKRNLIEHGFHIASRPYACYGPDPSLSECPPESLRSGLAWAIQPADLANGVPAIVSKAGGLGGFATNVAMMPDAQLGVVVFANSRGTLLPSNNPTEIDAHVARNVLYALYLRSRNNTR